MDQQKQVITLDLLPPTQDDSQDQDYFIFRLRGSQPKPSFALICLFGGWRKTITKIFLPNGGNKNRDEYNGIESGKTRLKHP